jgi:hypothetical protein
MYSTPVLGARSITVPGTTTKELWSDSSGLVLDLDYSSTGSTTLYLSAIEDQVCNCP